MTMKPYARRVLVGAADERYSAGLIVAVASALQRLPRHFEVDVVVFDDGLGARSRRELARIVERARTQSTLHIVPGYSQIRKSHLGDDLPGRLHVTDATYSRLLIPELSPEIERVVYVDSDLLVTDDISELFSIDLSEDLFAACRDVVTPTFETGVPYSYSTLGLKPDLPYFNAGVLVFDVETWRQAAVGEQTAEYVRNWDANILTPDQDGLNVVAADRVREFDRRYNFQLSGEIHAATASRTTRSLLRYTEDVAIVHFTGPKPWISLWFGSVVWGRLAARWWLEVLRSRLLSTGFRLRLLWSGSGVVWRELLSRVRRSQDNKA